MQCDKCGGTELNYAGKCKPCRKQYLADRRAKEPERHRAIDREKRRKWRLANPEKEKEQKERCRQKWLSVSGNREKLNARAREKKAALQQNNPEKIRAWGLQQRLSNPIASLIAQVKHRAAKMGIPFNLTKDDLSIPEMCPYLGIPLVSGAGKGVGAGPNAPSVDRLRPELGYVKSNVEVISLLANRIKQNASSIEVQAVADAMKARGL